MSLFKPICVGYSTILVIAVINPVVICHKPLCIRLHPPQEDVNCDTVQNNQNLECEYVQNSPLMTSFTPKDKKYDCGTTSIFYEPFIARESTVSLPTIPSCPDFDFRIIKAPSVHKTLTHVEDKTVRHIPVIHKVTRNVVECRTRHIPVIKHRLRTVEEKYTEHVPVTETIMRPVVDTVVKQVPVIEAKRRRMHQRIKPIPAEQRVVNELFKLRQNPLYRQGVCGLSYLCPQQYNQAYVPC